MVFCKGIRLLFGVTGSWALRIAVPAFENTPVNITVQPPTSTVITPDAQMSISDPSVRLQSIIEDFQENLASVEAEGGKEPGQARLVNSEPILGTEEEGNFTIIPPRPASAPGREGMY
jgi:hypothetical protein